MPQKARVEAILGGVRGRKHGVIVSLRQMVAVEEPPFCDACTVIEAQGANLPLELEWRPGEGLVSGTPIDLAGRLIDDVAQGLLAELRFALRRLTVAHGKVEIVLEEWTASRAAVELAA